jgi:hypothetical protein
MMNHIGTALIVAIGSMISYLLYPNIGALFVVSPLAMIGVYYNMLRIKPTHVDRDAARALIIESPTMTEYEHLETKNSVAHVPMDHDDDDDTDEGNDGSSELSRPEEQYYEPPVNVPDTREPKNNIVHVTNNMLLESAQKPGESASLSENETTKVNQQRLRTREESSMPSFNLGWGSQSQQSESSKTVPPRARTPWAVLRDPTLVTFTLVLFTFHLSNSSVLPLVMQSLTIEDERSGILLSGMCILIGQGFMSWFAKICGDYSPKWGRKGLTLVALSSLTVRCFFLTLLVTAEDDVKTDSGAIVIKCLILSTQILDSVGAGIFGTMHILVTNDISCRTGRFSLMMGITTGAMCLGATVSGYFGQAIAEDYGYEVAFTCLGMMSLVPLFLYVFCMPETLPDYVKPERRKRRLMAILRKLNEQRQNLALKATNPFRRRKMQRVTVQPDGEKHEGLIAPSTHKEIV